MCTCMRTTALYDRVPSMVHKSVAGTPMLHFRSFLSATTNLHQTGALGFPNGDTEGPKWEAFFQLTKLSTPRLTATMLSL